MSAEGTPIDQLDRNPIDSSVDDIIRMVNAVSSGQAPPQPYVPPQGGYQQQQQGYPQQQQQQGYQQQQQQGYSPPQYSPNIPGLQQQQQMPQQGYPQQQQGYPPQQGYPQQQQEYPPQQGYPPQQHQQEATPEAVHAAMEEARRARQPVKRSPGTVAREIREQEGAQRLADSRGAAARSKQQPSAIRKQPDNYNAPAAKTSSLKDTLLQMFHLPVLVAIAIVCVFTGPASEFIGAWVPGAAGAIYNGALQPIALYTRAIVVALGVMAYRFAFKSIFPAATSV